MCCFSALLSEFMRPHDNRIIFTELVLSGQDDVILDHGTVSGERHVVLPMGMPFW